MNMSRYGVIEPTEDEKCQLCGKMDECRPYGPNGENVCYECGMKDPAAVERGMARLIGPGISLTEAVRIARGVIEPPGFAVAFDGEKRKPN